MKLIQDYSVFIGVQVYDESKDSQALSALQRTVIQHGSVAQSFPTLCYPINRNTPGLPVHHQLLELAQTHAHRVGDATWLVSNFLLRPASS